jgi:hypothetical protein
MVLAALSFVPGRRRRRDGVRVIALASIVRLDAHTFLVANYLVTIRFEPEDETGASASASASASANANVSASE